MLLSVENCHSDLYPVLQIRRICKFVPSDRTVALGAELWHPKVYGWGVSTRVGFWSGDRARTVEKLLIVFFPEFLQHYAMVKRQTLSGLYPSTWWNYSDFTRPMEGKWDPLFQGNLGWWNILIWPESTVCHYENCCVGKPHLVETPEFKCLCWWQECG